MHVHRAYRIDRAVSRDPSRPTLHDVLLEGDRLVATDGHLLAVVPVERHETDRDGLIPPAALEESRRRTARSIERLPIEAGEVVQTLAGTRYARPTHAFPDWRQLVPRAATIRHRVRLNPRLLLALAEALGAGAETERGVILHLPRDPEAAILVTPGAGDDRSFGVLMPMRFPTGAERMPEVPPPSAPAVAEARQGEAGGGSGR